MFQQVPSSATLSVILKGELVKPITYNILVNEIIGNMGNSGGDVHGFDPCSNFYVCELILFLI
jgi:hypothetical protein